LPSIIALHRGRCKRNVKIVENINKHRTKKRCRRSGISSDAEISALDTAGSKTGNKVLLDAQEQDHNSVFRTIARTKPMMVEMPTTTMVQMTVLRRVIQKMGSAKMAL